MINTANMGLIAWDTGTDHFEHSQLADNFLVIDKHDHAAGKGAALSGESLKDHSITNKQLGVESVHQENVAVGSIGLEQLEGNVLPLGSVILWYRQSSFTALPKGGWEILDGRSWSSVTNSLGYSSGKMPNMIERFPYGATPASTGTTIGSEGGVGTLDLRHSHTVESHHHSLPTHAHSVGSHSHTIAADGAHNHGFHEGLTEHPQFPLYQHIVQPHTGPASTGVQALWLPQAQANEGLPEAPVGMENDGVHSHGGNTGGTSPFTSGEGGGGFTGSVAPTTDAQLSNVSALPPYVGLLYIMRVR